MLNSYLKFWLIASTGGCLFGLIHIPLPWTLGPMVIIAVVKNLFKLQFRQLMPLSLRMRRVAVMVLGYALGSAFTPQVGAYILNNLLVILGLTVVTIVICLFGGCFFGRVIGVGAVTSLLGSMPGSMMQIVSVCKEVKEADMSAVIMMQTVRTITVVFLAPFIVMHGLVDQVSVVNQISLHPHISEMPTLVVFAAVIAASTLAAQKLKITGAFIIAPIVSTAALVLSGVQAPTLPSLILLVAQICFGIPMGMMISVNSIANWQKFVVCNFVSVVVVILMLLTVDYFYAGNSNVDIVTAFISSAPAGISEMGLTAMAVKADLATVVAFQLFRLIFILLVVMPAVRWWLLYRKRDKDGAETTV